MSERELAKSLIDQIPESRLYYVIAYLQGAMIPDETPNAATLAKNSDHNLTGNYIGYRECHIAPD